MTNYGDMDTESFKSVLNKCSTAAECNTLMEQLAKEVAELHLPAPYEKFTRLTDHVKCVAVHAREIVYGQSF